VEQGPKEGAQFPGRQSTAGGAEKSQQCHRYFLQQHICFRKTLDSNICGRQTRFLPRALSNLITPLLCGVKNGPGYCQNEKPIEKLIFLHRDRKCS